MTDNEQTVKIKIFEDIYVFASELIDVIFVELPKDII